MKYVELRTGPSADSARTGFDSVADVVGVALDDDVVVSIALPVRGGESA